MFGFSPISLIVIGVVILLVYLAAKGLGIGSKGKSNYNTEESRSIFSPSDKPNKVDEYLGFGGPFRSSNPDYMIYKELKRANELKERELNQSNGGKKNYSACDWANEEPKKRGQ